MTLSDLYPDVRLYSEVETIIMTGGGGNGRDIWGEGGRWEDIWKGWRGWHLMTCSLDVRETLRALDFILPVLSDVLMY